MCFSTTANRLPYTNLNSLYFKALITIYAHVITVKSAKSVKFYVFRKVEVLEVTQRKPFVDASTCIITIFIFIYYD